MERAMPKVEQIEGPANFLPNLPAFIAMVELAQKFSLNRENEGEPLSVFTEYVLS